MVFVSPLPKTKSKKESKATTFAPATRIITDSHSSILHVQVYIGVREGGVYRRARAEGRDVRAYLAERTPELELLRVGQVVLDERYHISVRGHLRKLQQQQK